MAYNTPFKYLRSTDASTLSSPNYLREREIYIDCLAMLHDLISPYEMDQRPSVFAGFNQPITRQLINATAAILHQRVSIINENIQANADTAFDLVTRIQASPFASPAASQIYPLATAYNNRLLSQYSRLR